MCRAMLAGLQHRQHVRPDLDVVVNKIPTQLFNRLCVERALHQRQFLTRPIAVPGVAAARFNFFETGRPHRIRIAQGRRHADVLLSTGPVTWNMRQALERTYAETPSPKWVVALGDCAANCGVFTGSYACAGAVRVIIPVNLHIAGCPPPRIEILNGLLALVDAMAK
jgi:Ni,Fe-hydrogenase III small subunit